MKSENFQVLWKALAVSLILYSIVAGLSGPVPQLFLLHESIRNLYFHVTMWFAMIFVLMLSFVFSISYLRKAKVEYDIMAQALAKTGLVFGIIGIATGAIWARCTWGWYWTNDPKLNGAAISLLIYFAYFVLRDALPDQQKKGRVAAVYNIFAFVIYIVFIGILPRLTDSLHPGSGGNETFSNLDIDNRMRWIFRPAVLGWMLMGLWISQVVSRVDLIRYWKKTKAVL